MAVMLSLTVTSKEAVRHAVAECDEWERDVCRDGSTGS